jgi:DNA end-binding protein Ku
MRSIWNGMLHFGLVQIPVKLYPAVRSNDMRFHYLHKTDGGRIKHERVCTKCEQRVEVSNLVRGHEFEKDEYVTLTDEDFAKVQVDSTHFLTVEGCVDPLEINSVFFDKPYYLAPDAAGAHSYALLREALKRAGRVAVTQIVLHDREHVGIIKSEGRVLFLNLLYFADEIVSSRGLPIPRQNETLDDDEIAMAEQLVDRMTESFTPEKYQDDYRQGLLTLMDKKRDGTRVRTKPQLKPKPTGDEYLVETLKASIDRIAGKRKRLVA